MAASQLLRLTLLAGLVFLGAQAIDCGNAKSHNATFGKRTSGDQLLYMDTPKKSSSFLRVVETDVSFPLPSDNAKGKITYIEVVDQYTNGKGGCAYITKGGIGSRDVTIHIKSQRNHGFNFAIKVYGFPY